MEIFVLIMLQIAAAIANANRGAQETEIEQAPEPIDLAWRAHVIAELETVMR